MAKEKRRMARPKTSAKMVIMGGLHLLIPAEKIQELADGKEIRLTWGKAREFNLQIESGQTDQIVESCLWFDPESTTISIDNNIREDNQNGGDSNAYLTDTLAIVLKESAKSDLGFNVTPAQAKALAAVLMRYVQAWEACDALRAEPDRA